MTMNHVTPQTAVKQLRLFIPSSTFRKLSKKSVIAGMLDVTRGEDPEKVARSLMTCSANWINDNNAYYS